MTRIRQRGNPNEIFYGKYGTSFTSYNCRTSPPPPSVCPNPGNLGVVVGPKSHKVITDELTPGYFTKVKKGELLPVNPCTIRSSDSYGIEEYEHTWEVVAYDNRLPCTNGRRYVTFCNVVKGFPVNLPPFPSLRDPAPLVPDAIADFRSKLWDVGTFAAEFGKTVELVNRAGIRFAEHSERIAKAVKLKRGGRGKQSAAEFMLAFSNAWLETRYGWRILAYDIEAAQEAYQTLNRTSPNFRGSSSDTSSETTFTPWFNPGTYSGLECWFRWQVTTEKRIRAFCGGVHNIDIPVSVDPIVTAYELIPYSFVADWFLNIGANLQAYSPFARGDLKYVGTVSDSTSICVAETRFNLSSDFQLIGNTFNWNGIVPHSVRRQYQRSRVVNPSFDFGFRPKLNKLKAIDAVALIATGLSRPLRVFARR